MSIEDENNITKMYTFDKYVFGHNHYCVLLIRLNIYQQYVSMP